MRVITGSAKGHSLKGPPGPGTRPMSDKIRQAVFSSMTSLGLSPERVLDLYAGTGSIGIEALSRGATWADFVEEDPAACAIIQSNLAHTKLADRAQVYRQTVQSYLRRKTKPYDLIAVDPPYADPHIVGTLELIGGSALVQSGSILVLGHSPRVNFGDRLGALALVLRRCHGDSCYSIFEVGAPDFSVERQGDHR